MVATANSEKGFMRKTRSRSQSRMAIPTLSCGNVGMAAALSLIVPGAGQIYRGNVNSGLKWFMLVPLGYFAFIIPGLILHMTCIYRAGNHKLYTK